MPFKVVIPARYASSRLPGKPLADIAGRPMVVRVAERAARSGADEVIIATDHAGVYEAAERHGHRAILTRGDHASGTERLAEVVDRMGWGDDTVVVNVQGDEPLIDPCLIGRVARELEADPGADVSTACHPIRDVEEFRNPNVVKVVCDARGHALYFSRAPIPWPRDAGDTLPPGLPSSRHIGLYGYRAGFLRRYAGLEPSAIERFEALEQLRALWHGFRVRVVMADRAPEAGVDTEADLARVRKKFDAGLD